MSDPLFIRLNDNIVVDLHSIASIRKRKVFTYEGNTTEYTMWHVYTRDGSGFSITDDEYELIIKAIKFRGNHIGGSQFHGI